MSENIQEKYNNLLIDIEHAEFTVEEYNHGTIKNNFRIDKTKESIEEMKKELKEIEENYPEVTI